MYKKIEAPKSVCFMLPPPPHFNVDLGSRRMNEQKDRTPRCSDFRPSNIEMWGAGALVSDQMSARGSIFLSIYSLVLSVLYENVGRTKLAE